MRAAVEVAMNVTADNKAFAVRKTILWHSFMCQPPFTKYLLADAEVGEDLAQHLVGGDLAGDGAQVVEALADVLTDQVAGQAVAQAHQGAPNGVMGSGQGLVVAGVGDDDGVVVDLG